ncbi:MAG: ParB N-terminal domain-containing protein [Oscillospiraceae bacterium]|nr:ParB N-terminal domain-containing protein [Oscillospiraceae bacterium]
MAATNKDKPKPRLKNLDDLFQLNDGVNPLEQSVPIIETQPHNKRAVTSIAIDKLTPFAGHPFRLYEGERLDDMVASIKANGVLVPIIVRKVDTTLEILAGHNRVNAAKLAGFDEVPAIVYENISDEDAMIYVIETNLLQRSFTDMTHTEKAAVISLHHSKMFSQGKRNDILEQIKMLENPHEYKENETCSQVANKLKTISKVGQEYGLSKDTVARYLRINQLITKLKIRLDNGDIAFLPAVILSFLKEAEQELIDDCMERNGLSVDMKKADLLRQFSEKGKLNGENVYKVLSGETTPKPNRTPTVKIDKWVYSRYFKPNQPAKEVQETVEKALEMYFDKQQ